MADQPVGLLRGIATRRGVVAWLAALTLAVAGLAGPIAPMPGSPTRAEGAIVIRLPPIRQSTAELATLIRAQGPVSGVRDSNGLAGIGERGFTLDKGAVDASRLRFQQFDDFNEITLPPLRFNDVDAIRSLDVALGEQVFAGLPAAVVVGSTTDLVHQTRFALVEQAVGGLGPDVRRVSPLIRSQTADSWLKTADNAEAVGMGPDSYLQFITADPAGS